MALSVASQAKQIEVSYAHYGAWSSTLEFSVFLNRAPEAPVLSAPVNAAVNQDIRPLLTWEVPADPENNDLDFHIQVDLLSTFDSQTGLPLIEASSNTAYQNFSFSAPVAPNSGTVSYQTPTDLLSRRVYYWRVRAFDGERYGDWSETYNFTVGILATRIVLSANRFYLPLSGTKSTITATYVDSDNNIDVAYEGATTFVQSQQLMGFLNPVMAPITNGVSTVEYTASGRQGATKIEVASSLPHSPILLYSTRPSTIPVLIEPANGARLASDSRPHFLWMVPNNINNQNMHFKIEIYDAPLFNENHLVYERDSNIDSTGFSYTNAVAPLSPDVWHDMQTSLPDGQYWWRIIPWDSSGYKAPSEAFRFSMPNQMVIVSKPLLSEKPVHQVVLMANVVLETNNEVVPAEARHYVTNMALEPENEIIWHDVTEHVAKRRKFVFRDDIIPAHGWAVAIKTVINANQTTGAISFNGHGVVFDGDYSETINEDYVGVVSALTPISFQALPSIDGNTLTLSWAYMDLNSGNRRIIDKFVLEVYNPETGFYEPYDGDKGEILA